MSIEESRNCGCNNNNNINNAYDTSNYMMNSYNTNNCPNQEVNMVDCDLQREMLHQIMCYDFAINELALYLDTHVDDEKALCLHRKYCKEAKELKDKYQKVYGPLTINYPCNKWRWIEEPWPWERGKY